MNEHLRQILRHLHSVKTMQEIALKGDLLASIQQVQRWQCKRLLFSHQALHQQDQYKPALAFFVHDLYGPHDFSQRDQDLTRLAPKMAKILPDKALRSLESALHLNALSFELDYELAKHLDKQPLNRDNYLKAYQDCNNPQARLEQIQLIEIMAKNLADAVQMRGVSALLMMSRKPAHLMGVSTLHTFIESGFKAFKTIGNYETFILPIVHFEQNLMKQMFNTPSTNPLPLITLDDVN